MIITRTDVKRGPCQRCSIIRSFVLFTFMLIILALVGGDRFAVIDFLTPAWFATAIIVIGITGFLVKLISWKFFNRRI